MKIEYVPFSDQYECLPKIVGVLDTGARRILAGSKECLKKVVMEHVCAHDEAQGQELLHDIELSCPLPQTIDELPRDHRVLIIALNRTSPNMWEGVIRQWIAGEKKMKSQV